MPSPKGFPDVRGFLPVSMNEWDGHIACILFLQGCNLLCPFCHGWRFVTQKEPLPPIAFETIAQSLQDNEGWIDGAVISGGEPTLAVGLSVLVDWLHREMKLDIKLHTNGTNPRSISMLLAQKLLACLAMDFKAPLTRDAYRKATGIAKLDVEPVRESFRLAGASGIPLEFHTTLCPGVMTLDELKPMAESLAELAPTGRWFLQQYHAGDVLDINSAGTKTWTLNDIEDKLPELLSIFPNIELQGYTG